MILATRQPNGKVKYFDANSGKEYKPGRETGRHEGRIPDEVIGFLSSKIERITGITRRPEPATNSDSQFKTPLRIVPPEKPSWLSLLIAWIKSLFDGNN
jgi:hypothetical protein